MQAGTFCQLISDITEYYGSKNPGEFIDFGPFQRLEGIRKPLPFLVIPPDEGVVLLRRYRLFCSDGTETTCYVDKTEIKTPI